MNLKLLKNLQEEDYVVSGKQIDLEEYLCNRLVEIPEIVREENIQYIDIKDFIW